MRLKHLKISLHSRTLDESKDHCMSEGSVSAELVRRLQTPVVLRNTITIKVSSLQQASTPLMKARFFQTLAKLTDFASIRIRVKRGFRRQSSPYMSYQSGASPYNICDVCEEPSIAMGATREGFSSIWGPGSVRRERKECLITFKPRAYLGRSRLERETVRGSGLASAVV